MRFGESFGEACRFCGSTEIIVSPPSSAGNCAVCSEEALAWAARREQCAHRHVDVARHAILAAEAERRAAERARRRVARRAAVAQSGAAAWNALASLLWAGHVREACILVAAAYRARRLLWRALPPHADAAHNF